MASGFLISALLGDALRKTYHRGDMQVTTVYMIEGLKIGLYRVMLKRDFPTACWVPPTGAREAHSIYYGDLMLAAVFQYFCEQKKADIPEMPASTVLAEAAADRLFANLCAAHKKRDKRAKAMALPERTSIKPSRLDVLNEQAVWLKDNIAVDLWEELLEMLTAAVAAFGRHERQHARFTPQDLRKTVGELKTLKIPFDVFNLFEDARIEAISRHELNEPFGWLSFEKLSPLASPGALFHRCIQLEGVADTVALESVEVLPHGEDVSQAAESVEIYYRRAIACTTAEDLFPVMADFLTEFAAYYPPPPEAKEGEEESEGGGGGAGGGTESGSTKSARSDDRSDAQGADLSIAAEAAEKGEKFFEEFEDDSEVVGGTDKEGKDAEAKAKATFSDGRDLGKGKGGVGSGIPESIAPQESGGRATPSAFLAELPGAVDAHFRARIDDVTAKLMRMFKAHNLPAATEAPGRRMSSRHLARNEIRFLHKKVMGGKSKRNYSIVYDCSGSMAGQPDREGKIFLLALNNLARRGYLKGSLVLSGWVGGQPGWLQYEFPVSEEVILRISPSHVSEGLQSALKDNLKHIKGMDDVFVYTDANICDAPLDRDFFASHRIWPVGLYVGHEEGAKEMSRHFPQNIIRTDIEQVVETMLTRNRRTVG